MRGTHTDLDSLQRGVVHALELTLEDADRWTAKLDSAEMELCPAGLPSVGFHLRHMARSLDRLLTYAEGRSLNEHQLLLLQRESEAETREATLLEFRSIIATGVSRVRNFTVQQLEEPRGIGRKMLPTTVGGLLVHCAEHTQRHCGQMVTTAKFVSNTTYYWGDALHSR